MSYGWSRAELVGALINGSFLVALCVYVALELVARLVRPPTIDGERFGVQFIIVASLGLAVNTMGTLAFWCSGAKSFHSHSHSHSHADSHRSDDVSDIDEHDHHSHAVAHGDARNRAPAAEPLLESNDVRRSSAQQQPPQQQPAARQWNANRYSIFLHYLGDALSSLVVLVVGIVLKYNPTAAWAVYLDAGASAAIILFLLWSTVPLMKRVAVVLMQSVPPGLKLALLSSQLRAAAPGIVGLHDLHVWRLDEQQSIGTVHVVLDEVRFRNAAEHVVLRARLSRVFHDCGVHVATVQLEPDRIEGSGCSMQCVEDCVFRETFKTPSPLLPPATQQHHPQLQHHEDDSHDHHSHGVGHRHHGHSHGHHHHAPTVATSGVLTGK